MNRYQKSVSGTPAQFINGCLDRLIRPHISLLGRRWNAYLLWQGIGITMGTAMVLAVTDLRNLSPVVMAFILVVAVLLIVLLFKSPEWFGPLLPRVELWGRPLPLLFVWAGSGIYHFQIAIIALAAGLLWLLREPVLPYLDVLVIGLSVGQVNGRIGCFMVGCCHGRPFSIGGRYGDEHLEGGYVNYLWGVRLFPVQLLESSWLLVITVILLTLNLTRMLPGEALAWYVIAYGFGRFFFEFLRADTIRLFFQGFSEAQWTALLLMSTVVYLEMATPLIFHWWHAAATLVLLAIVVFVILMRRDKRLERYELLQPSHLKDFAETVSWLFDLVAGGIAVTSESLRPASPVEGLTSGHVRLAAVGIEDQNGRTFRYSISYQQGIMKAEIARLLAGLIRQLQHPADAYELVENEPGVFTLSIHHTPQQ